MKHIYFTVTNDLTYDQRMHRICSSLAHNGYRVTLIGRKLNNSKPLKKQLFEQRRLSCLFNKSFLFYAEYNLRLFFFLWTRKMDAICAIDLDTILPCLYISKIKRIPRIYDAHEYFTELKEVNTRPLVKRIWSAIEKRAIPQFNFGYTVSEGLARLFNDIYKKQYIVIRNMPQLKPLNFNKKREKLLLYQGAVNEGRGFEYLIPAMKNIPYQLIVCGDGNFMAKLKELITEHHVQDKVILKGMQEPDKLIEFAQSATLGIALAEREGLNQFLALPNKFFDYIQAGLPQITMNYPEYREINDQYNVAYLLDNLDPNTISDAINHLMTNEALLEELGNNCLKAREELNWSMEVQKLTSYYQSIFNG